MSDQPENTDEPEIPFAPVPRLRRRRNGWSEERQRAFIFACRAAARFTAARAGGRARAALSAARRRARQLRTGVGLPDEGTERSVRRFPPGPGALRRSSAAASWFGSSKPSDAPLCPSPGDVGRRHRHHFTIRCRKLADSPSLDRQREEEQRKAEQVCRAPRSSTALRSSGCAAARSRIRQL